MALALLAGCTFPHGEPVATDRDARLDESAPKDAALDTNVDARTCPAMIGCTAFQCASTSSCYYYCTTKTNWLGAKNACDDVTNGCLVTINDQMEQDCIVANVMPTFANFPWIGFVQDPGGAEPAGGWGFTCGASAFAAWNTGEPNNADVPGEDCAGMTDGGRWFDMDCTDPGRYVCEVQ